MKLGLIVGTGDVPRLIAEHRKASSEETFVIAIKGFEEPWIDGYEHAVCGIAEIGRLLKLLHGAGCNAVSFIGNVKRPDFSKLKPDLKGISLLPRVLKAARKGDDALLRCLVELFEQEGFEVKGAHELLDTLTRQAEILGKHSPDQEAADDLVRAYFVSGEMGRLDIGQGAVVARGLVLAVESQEGTDEMLRRVGRLPENLRGTEDDRVGVLVKRPKPIQERRVDLPTIGESTIRFAAEAGLAAVAGVENATLWINSDEIIRLADAFGISLISLNSDGTLP